jgi:deoxyribodipyrimidine photo-lyase
MTRNILIALLRADLRLHDHPIFSACSSSSDQLKNVTHVLPVYIFDQKYMEVGGINGIQKGDGPGGKGGAKTRVAGFWRCGVHRVRCVNEMEKKNYLTGAFTPFLVLYPPLLDEPEQIRY